MTSESSFNRRETLLRVCVPGTLLLHYPKGGNSLIAHPRFRHTVYEVERLTSEQIIQYAERFSRDPSFLKVKPNGRDRASYVYKVLMPSADYSECTDIADRGWAITEARLVPRLLELRAKGIAKSTCATDLGVSLGQVNRWLTEPS